MSATHGWVSRSERKGHAVFVVGDPTSTELPSLIFELGVRPKKEPRPSQLPVIATWAEIAASYEVKEAAK
jgi:hypothetical protein